MFPTERDVISVEAARAGKKKYRACTWDNQNQKTRCALFDSMHTSNSCLTSFTFDTGLYRIVVVSFIGPQAFPRIVVALSNAMHLIFTSICLNSNVVQITQKYLVAYIVVLGVQEAPFL
jgi:hypothetical protein